MMPKAMDSKTRMCDGVSGVMWQVCPIETGSNRPMGQVELSSPPVGGPDREDPPPEPPTDLATNACRRTTTLQTAFTDAGGLAEVAMARADLVVRVPTGLDLERAAAAPGALTTTALLLTGFGRLRRGEVVLAHGAGGAVGQALARLARLAGAGLVLGTVGTDSRRACAEQAGYDATIVRGPSWPQPSASTQQVAESTSFSTHREPNCSNSTSLSPPQGRASCSSATPPASPWSHCRPWNGSSRPTPRSGFSLAARPPPPCASPPRCGPCSTTSSPA